MQLEQFFAENIQILLPIMVWVLLWKGYAMWTAAQLKHKGWFIVLLIANTVAILDIFYIFFIAKKGKALLSLIKGKKKEEV